MMIFSADKEIVRLILTRIASYSISLLDLGKSNRMACSNISPVRALSVKPTPAPVCQEAPSTLRIHQSVLLRFESYYGILDRKSVKICPFNAKRGLYLIPNSLSSIARRIILLDKSSLCIVLRK